MSENDTQSEEFFGNTSLSAALADREANEINQEMLASLGIDFAPPNARGISQRPYDLIVNHETGGRRYYEKVYGGRPVWPGENSGVTIGFGYDLGYVGANEFQFDWRSLGTAAVGELSRCVGKHGGNTEDASLKALTNAVRHIVIAWEQSEVVFKAVTVPKFSSLTTKSLSNTDDLTDDCYGSLVSLTFNRGASYGIAWNRDKDPIDRYKEMRAIKADMANREFGAIPVHIRAMKRIWKGKTIEAEMTKRREEEAALFEAGLRNA